MTSFLSWIRCRKKLIGCVVHRSFPSKLETPESSKLSMRCILGSSDPRSRSQCRTFGPTCAKIKWLESYITILNLVALLPHEIPFRQYNATTRCRVQRSNGQSHKIQRDELNLKLHQRSSHTVSVIVAFVFYGLSLKLRRPAVNDHEPCEQATCI